MLSVYQKRVTTPSHLTLDQFLFYAGQENYKNALFLNTLIIISLKKTLFISINPDIFQSFNHIPVNRHIPRYLPSY